MQSKKYSAIVFDLHDVLFLRDYKKMLLILFATPGKCKLLITIFNPYFLYDLLCLYRKTRVTEQYIITLGTKYPALAHHIQRGIAITNALIPCKELFNLVQQLKHHGYSLYIFSNIGMNTYELLMKEYSSFFTMFDGIHYTHAHNNWVQKPLPLAYNLFVERFKLDPASLIFIDDSKKNSNAAQQYGITSIHYTSADTLKHAFLNLGILPTG